MVLSFFFLMNVILSSVVGEYDSAVENRQKERINLSERNLKEAFRLLDSAGSGRIDRDIVMALFFILNEDFPEYESARLFVNTLSLSFTSCSFSRRSQDSEALR
jgi:hypothetical protein